MTEQIFVGYNEDLSLTQIILNAIESRLVDLHTAFPAKVVNYDSGEQKVSVQPLLKHTFLDGVTEDLAKISNVPVMFPCTSGGDCYIHLPIKEGDTGICIVNEKSIDKWKSSSNNVPMEADDVRHHNLTDIVFYPGVRTFPSAFTVKDPNELVLKNNSMQIALSPKGRVKLQGKQYELLRVLEGLVNNLISAKTVTMLGASSFTADTVTNLTSDLNKLKTLIN